MNVILLYIPDMNVTLLCIPDINVILLCIPDDISKGSMMMKTRMTDPDYLIASD